VSKATSARGWQRPSVKRDAIDVDTQRVVGEQLEWQDRMAEGRQRPGHQPSQLKQLFGSRKAQALYLEVPFNSCRIKLSIGRQDKNAKLLVIPQQQCFSANLEIFTSGFC